MAWIALCLSPLLLVPVAYGVGVLAVTTLLCAVTVTPFRVARAAAKKATLFRLAAAARTSETQEDLRRRGALSDDELTPADVAVCQGSIEA